MRDTSSLYPSIGVLIVLLYNSTGIGYDLEGFREDGGGEVITNQQQSVFVTGMYI